MSNDLRTRLVKLEQRKKARPEVKTFWRAPGETWEQLRKRARAWQAEKPEARWPEPLLIGCRDDADLDPDMPRRFHE